MKLTQMVPALIYFIKIKNETSKLMNRWMPKAGKTAENTWGWGITQLMYTPKDIRKAEPDPNDFPYAGALFITRSLHSSDPKKKYSLQTELQFGLIGPNSFAKEAQIAFHRLINYQKPMGWDHQLPTDLVINLNFTTEKEIWHKEKWLEITGGTQLMAGTLMTGVSAYSLIRLGKMTAYYNGYIGGYSIPRNIEGEEGKKWQGYIVMKPRLDYQFHNSLISGGYFNGNRSEIIEEARRNNLAVISIPHHHILGFDYGFSLVCANTGVSVTQKIESAGIRGVTNHEVGNISFFKSW